MSELYIGLMSGTSMDAVDAVLTDFSQPTPTIVATHSHPIPTDLLKQLKQLCASSEHEINLMGICDRRVALLFAEAVCCLLEKSACNPQQVIAIGSHGQTIRHHPNKSEGFTLQIGDGNTLSAITQIDVIADFRRKDIALGGQGAPLVPAFHKHVFADNEHERIILNIGGIANFTYLPKNPKRKLVGQDTGPGNILLDEWCKTKTGKSYDKDARFARTGSTDHQLLQQMLNFDYFSAVPPKSTGRETFNLGWIENQLNRFSSTVTEPNVQATLVELTAKSIALEIHHVCDEGELYVCGGGAHNPEIMRHLNLFLPSFKVAKTNELGINADWVEAVAFAWLAYAHINGIPGNIPEVTGAIRPAILGAKYPHQ